jgi:hypothetical protein
MLVHFLSMNCASKQKMTFWQSEFFFSQSDSLRPCSTHFWHSLAFFELRQTLLV